MYEGLLKGIRDAGEVAALVDAVSPGLRPRPHGQVVEQVAVVVVRVRRPEATLGVPSCAEIKIEVNTHGVRVFRPTRKPSRCVGAENQADLAQRWEAGEAVLVPWLRNEDVRSVFMKQQKGWRKKQKQTFFADKFLCGRAKIIVELPGLVVVHPSELDAVFVVLPVVWLVRRPWEEVLGVVVGGVGVGRGGVKACLQSSCRSLAAYRRGSVRVNEVVFAADVVEADPGGCWQVSCGPEGNLSTLFSLLNGCFFIFTNVHVSRGCSPVMKLSSSSEWKLAR